MSVLTPSIPERARYLAELEASVDAQTYTGWEHLVHVDERRDGCAKVVNMLAREAKGEWLLIVADDDLLLPRCLEILLEHSGEADVVYAPPLVWGNSDMHFYGRPPYIPSFGLIHVELWEEIGGYNEAAIREEDRKLWTKALELDANFVRADEEPTWIYRFHGGNKSYRHGVAA